MNKHSNRIKVNGVWYVKEDSLQYPSDEESIKFNPDDITSYFGAVFENDTSCFDFSVLLDNDGSLYAPSIKYTDKRELSSEDWEKEYWDNEKWFNGLIEGNEESLNLLSELDTNDVNVLIEFLKIIKEKCWF